jgi:nucleoside-diphosphate-sugar epimerase
MKVLVTGASGLVGAATVAHFTARGWQAVAQSRSEMLSLAASPSIERLQLDIDQLAQHPTALQTCDAIVHTAARVHQVRELASNPLAEYRRVNTELTLALARAAAAQGVKRFVFISSIKVNGEWTSPGKPFTADDTPAPADPYGMSKHEAEMGLHAIAQQTGLEVVIVRPPLVYGPGVRANFLTMMRWLQRGIPLPLGAIHNQRSLVALDNLLDLLQVCATHPAAANQTFLASDGQDVSTTELLQALAHALKRSPRLMPVPQAWLERTLGLLGRAAIAQRLCGNLAVDIAKTRHLLQWSPPVTLAQGLRTTAEHFLAQTASGR